MKKEAFLTAASAILIFSCLASVSCEGGAPTEGKVNLSVLYIGYPGTAREKDFLELLEKHFTKVGKGDIDKFEVKDAEAFDVVILDYGGLSVKDNVTRPPRVRVPFDRSYTRPTVTMSAVGGLACDQLGLKTGYF